MLAKTTPAINPESPEAKCWPTLKRKLLTSFDIKSLTRGFTIIRIILWTGVGCKGSIHSEFIELFNDGYASGISFGGVSGRDFELKLVGSEDAPGM